MTIRYLLSGFDGPASRCNRMKTVTILFVYGIKMSSILHMTSFVSEIRQTLEGAGLKTLGG